VGDLCGTAVVGSRLCRQAHPQVHHISTISLSDGRAICAMSHALCTPQDVGVGMLIQLLGMEGSHTPGFAAAAIAQIDGVLGAMVAAAPPGAGATCPLFPQYVPPGCVWRACGVYVCASCVRFVCVLRVCCVCGVYVLRVCAACVLRVCCVCACVCCVCACLLCVRGCVSSLSSVSGSQGGPACLRLCRSV
jgi:hypothetical protein